MSTQAPVQAPVHEKTSNPGHAIPDVPLAQHLNHTPFPSQYFQSVDKNGVVFHVVVLRVTYDMHQLLADGSLSYAAEQTPLATQDVWSGEVNTSSPLWESDFAPYKPKCDVLLVNAVSRPPQDKPAQRWPCGVSLTWQQATERKTWSKALSVTGPRHFGLLGVSQPEAATEVAIDWQHAYGGQMPETKAGRDDERIDERNPVGVGLHKARGQAAPQLELMGKPYTDGHGQSDYPPICLSAVGRAWLPRRQLAGTYDDAWLTTQWPLPPLDFDNGYWNCAPQDQQIEHLPPGVEMLLADVYPKSREMGTGTGTNTAMNTGTWRGKLPKHQLWMGLLTETKVQTLDQTDSLVAWQDVPMLLDTLVLDVASQQIYASYRHSTAAPDQASGSTLKEMHTVLTMGKPDQHVPIEDMGLLG
jgi:hypothetical protein